MRKGKNILASHKINEDFISALSIETLLNILSDTIRMKIKGIFSYLKFIVGGGLGLLVNLFVTYVFESLLGMPFPFAYAVGLSVNVVFNFVYHSNITFSRKDNAMSRFYRFVPVTLAVVLANYALVLLFADVVVLSNLIPLFLFQQFYNYFVIIAVTGVVSLLNFVLNRRWVFK